VVIIGGNLMGIETAEFIPQQVSKEVFVVEMQLKILPDISHDAAQVAISIYQGINCWAKNRVLRTRLQTQGLMH
jgi:pyruvate/2-oxoglutarate dehydrogenase complex dihydrolipoamide dehydrogenase (E3) component